MSADREEGGGAVGSVTTQGKGFLGEGLHNPAALGRVRGVGTGLGTRMPRCSPCPLSPGTGRSCEEPSRS